MSRHLLPTTALSSFDSRYWLVSLLFMVLSSLPFTAALAQEVTATQLLKQMIAIAADNGGLGRSGELNALKQQIAALPKPARGDTKKAQEANAKGLEAIKAGQPRASQATLSIRLSARSS